MVEVTAPATCMLPSIPSVANVKTLRGCSAGRVRKLIGIPRCVTADFKGHVGNDSIAYRVLRSETEKNPIRNSPGETIFEEISSFPVSSPAGPMAAFTGVR